MKTILNLLIIIFSSCLHSSDTIPNSKDILSKDSLIWNTSKTKYYQFPEISDSTNSFIQIVKDTCKIYLSTGWYEGSYSLRINSFDDSQHISLSLFENYTNYNYAAGSFSISFDKPNFVIGDYVSAKVNYQTIGEQHDEYQNRSDTIKVLGTIRLKVRDENFSFEDLMEENHKNRFYAESRQRPDTIKRLFLYTSKWFSEFPKEISLYKNLEELFLDGTDLSKANLNILCRLNKLKHLTMNECNLSQIPSCFDSLTQLEELELGKNNFTKVPESIYGMTNLKGLQLASNDIAIIPPNILKLINLEWLEITKTKINTLPIALGRLTKLKEIYTNDTMKYIPKSLLKYMQNDYFIQK